MTPRVLICAVTLMVLSAFSFAADFRVARVEVFVDSTVSVNEIKRLQAVTGGAQVTVHRTDLIAKAEARMSQDLKAYYRRLPAGNIDSHSVAQAANKLIHDGVWAAHINAIKKGGQARIQAVQYGVERVPAVVFDATYVVYGERPMAALGRYRAYLNGHGSK